MLFHLHRSLTFALIFSLVLGMGTACSEQSGEPVFTPLVLDSVLRTEVYSKSEVVSNVPAYLSESITDLLPSVRVKVASILYKTKAPDGSEVLASGIVSYPAIGIVRGVIVGLHYTYTSNADAPSSRMAVVETLCSLLGYAVIAPDYLGYGNTRQMVHPYLHASSTGSSCADMVLAGQEYLYSRRLISSPHVPISIIGYSQGGEAAVALQRTAETSYQGKIYIRRVFAGGGPYDLKICYKDLLESDYTSIPFVAPMLVLGMNYAEQLNLNPDQFFTGSFLSNYPQWILSKSLNNDQVTAAIGTHRLSDLMSAQAFDTTQVNTRLLLNALEASNLSRNWKPVAPLKMYHSDADEAVPYENARLTSERLKAAGGSVSFSTFHGKSHDGASVSFYESVLTEILNKP